MKTSKTISIFVDESGNFGDLSDPARYCIIAFVIHDALSDISRFGEDLDRAYSDLGLDPSTFLFHTAPLIRQEGVFSAMNRRMRGRILERMLTFVRRVDFRYRCFCLDTKFANSADQIFERLKVEIGNFLTAYFPDQSGVQGVSVYYDAGQKAVSRLLQEVFAEVVSISVAFVEGVRQIDYKLFQVADLVCTTSLIEQRLTDGLPMTHSEMRFFGGPRDFKRNILKKIKAKEI